MRRICLLMFFLLVWLPLAPKLEAALNVSIDSPADNSCFPENSTVVISGKYTCDKPDYALIFKIDGEQKSVLNASQGVDLPFSFSRSISSGVYTLTVELRKSGCYSASASINVSMFCVNISGSTTVAKGKEVSLTCNSLPTGLSGSYNWSVVQGGDKISIAGGGKTVSVNGLNVSGTTNDVTVKVEFTATGTPGHADATYDLTVFDVQVKASNAIDSPDPYVSVGGNRVYRVIVQPSQLSGFGSFSWSKEPSNTEVINIYPSSYNCEVKSETGQTGSATLKARFDSSGGSYAEKSLDIFVFRPNIVVGELSESAETDTGAYLARGGTKSCFLQLEGTLPSDATVTLSCDKTGKVSLWEGETQKSFPYQCLVSALPANLTLKGEAASDNLRDITLTLSTSRGGSDSAKITVFELESTKLYYHSLDEFPFTDSSVMIQLVATMKSGDVYQTSNPALTNNGNWRYDFSEEGAILWQDIWGNPSFVWRNVVHTIVNESAIKSNSDGSGELKGYARWYTYNWSNSSISNWGTTTTLPEGVHRYKTIMSLAGITKESPDKGDALKIKVRGNYQNEIVERASACIGVRYEWGGYSSDSRYVGGKESVLFDIIGADYSATGYVYLNGSWQYVKETGAAEGYGFDCSGIVCHAARIGRTNCTGLVAISDSIENRTELCVGDLLILLNQDGKAVHVRIVQETPTQFGDDDMVRWIGAEGYPASIVQFGETSFYNLEHPNPQKPRSKYIYRRL